MRPDQDRGQQEQAVEQGQAEHDALPAPVAPAAESEHDERQPERDGYPGAEAEVGQPDPDGDELGDQGDQVGQDQITAPNQPQVGP